VKSGYVKKEQIHGGGAGKQEMHTGLRVGNVSKKINNREMQQKEELLHIFKNI
jgi:hypothetical protein